MDPSQVLLQAEIKDIDDEDDTKLNINNEDNSNGSPNETSTPKKEQKSLYPTAPLDESDNDSTASAHSTSV